MADEFKSYDKTPIMSRLNISGWKIGIREIIFVAVAGSLLVLVLIFAGLYGSAESQLVAEGSAGKASAIVGSIYCTDKSCLQTAARVLNLMNKSVDPCENFFEYACGNYKVVKPMITDAGPRSVLNDMYQENQDKLIAILEKPVSQSHDTASERKLKHFFQSCNDMYAREKNRGTPFIKQVLPKLGGWKLLGTWDPSWDLNSALIAVQTDFWVDALYSPSVEVDEYDHTKSVIVIAPGGTGKFMRWRWYIDPFFEKIRQDYKKFLRRVATLMVRDSGTTTVNTTEQDSFIEEFVNDTLTVETNIAKIAIGAKVVDDPHDDLEKVSLTGFNTETGNVIDWLKQMSYMFNQAEITANTKIVVMKREYFKNITNMINLLPESDRNRMLHNYLIWRVLERYVQDMSWEYIHANREIYVDLFNRQDFSGVYRYCFWRARFYLSDALGALYIYEHLGEDNRNTVNDITLNIKLALQQQLAKTPWMDEETKKYALEKLDEVTFKMGYPDWMGNMAAVDTIYYDLTINSTDYFGNLIDCNQFHRAEWNKHLIKGDDREEWTYPIYHTVMAALLYWNEITAPAGILQNPIYTRDQPHFSTFGSLGSLLGRFLHHVVDEWGKFFNKVGDYTEPDSWWSNSSLEAYKPIRQCVVDVYTNVSKDYIYPDGKTRPYRINADNYAPIAISWTNGARLAQIGYRDWLKSKVIDEKMLPGLDLTNEQMIFLSHAQTYCYSRSRNLTSIRYRPRGVEEDVSVNMAFGQLKEFSEAYKCKPDSKMNHPVKCDYY